MPYKTQLRWCAEDWRESAGTVKGSLSHCNSNPGPAAGVTGAQADDRPKQLSFGPLGNTI